VGSIGVIKIQPQMPVVIPFNFLFGNITRQVDEMVVESFIDSEKFCVIDDNFRIEYALASAAGGIARADATLKEIDIDLGIKAVPIVGEGTGCINGRQGYILSFGTPKVTMTACYRGEASDPAWWAQMETPGPDNYLGLCQPTSNLATPAWAFFMPRCYIDPDTPPVLKQTGEDTLDATVTLIASTAGFTSTTNSGLSGDEGFAPWYMGCSGEAA
jgi:hypothetical protein